MAIAFSQLPRRDASWYVWFNVVILIGRMGCSFYNPPLAGHPSSPGVEVPSLYDVHLAHHIPLSRTRQSPILSSSRGSFLIWCAFITSYFR